MLRAILIVLSVAWICGAPVSEAVAQSDPVRRAQERLDALGLAPGPIDGVMGPQTRDALRAFQRSRQLPASGELDWQTRLALDAGVRSFREAKPAPVPRAAPVPEVTMNALPAPDAGGTVRDDADMPVAAAAAGTGTLPLPSRPALAQAQDRDLAPVHGDTAPQPVGTPDGETGLWPIGMAVALAIAAGVTWTGLLVLWLRQRKASRGAAPEKPSPSERGAASATGRAS